MSRKKTGKADLLQLPLSPQRNLAKIAHGYGCVILLRCYGISAGTTGILIRLPPPLSHICSNAHTSHVSGCRLDFFEQSIRNAVNVCILSNHNGIGKFRDADRLSRRRLCHLHRYVVRIDPCASWEIQNLAASFMELVPSRHARSDHRPPFRAPCRMPNFFLRPIQVTL